MPKLPNFLAKRLRADGEKMTTFFTDLNDTDWERIIYAEEGNWTIRSILLHLVTAEQAFYKLFASVLEGGEGAAEDFDLDRYNARQQEKFKDLSTDILLEQYQEIRDQMANWVETLTEDDLKIEARHPHPQLGVITMEEMVKMVYTHNQMHYRDIKKAS